MVVVVVVYLRDRVLSLASLTRLDQTGHTRTASRAKHTCEFL